MQAFEKRKSIALEAIANLANREIVPLMANRDEIPICGKTWWEDGTQYECLMDKGVHTKHGIRGMVRKVED